MKNARNRIGLIAIILLALTLCSCGPFGAGPWYLIFEGESKKDKTTPIPPGKTDNPAPAQSSTDVPVTAVLGWDEALFTNNYDVYLGTDAIAVANADTSSPEWMGNSISNTFDLYGNFNHDTTYYWRVDSLNAVGTTKGDLWSFTTELTPSTLPDKVTGPSPQDGVSNVFANALLSWQAAAGAESYDVYLGSVLSDVQNATNGSPEFKGNQTELGYDPPGDLAHVAIYYWRIDSSNLIGTTLGDVWSFTTLPPPPEVNFYAAPTSGFVPLTVAFTDATTGSVTSWSWDFNNDTIIDSTLQNPTHIYSFPGTYSVSLSTTGPGGSDTELKTNYITVDAPALNTVYVSTSGSDTTGDGSASKPYATIQKGIDEVTAGWTVMVTDGTYTGVGNRNLNFNGKAITVTSHTGPESCIIDCESLARGFLFNNAEQNDSILSSITIRNGYTGGEGAGINSSTNCKPTIDSCIIESCRSDSNGGAIACDRGRLIISGCIIRNNSADDGGAIYCDYADPLISECIITSNSADNYGGAIYLYGAMSDVDIENCIITENISTNASTSYGGGGIYAWSGCDVTVLNCLIARNGCTGDGAGIRLRSANCSITNSTIVENDSQNYGGGIALLETSAVTIENSIVWNNTGTAWAQIYSSSSSGTADYCDMNGGVSQVSSSVTQTNCITSEPDFVYATAGNYRLNTDSPCINTGSNTFVTAGDKDLDGKDRIINTTVDIGCYEYRALTVPSSYANIQAAIDAAETGDTVLIADGTFTGTGNKDMVYNGKTITVCSENGPAGCIIDCQNSGRGFYFNSSEGSHSVVMGLTIKNGDAGMGYGGAIYCDSTSPTIIRCILNNNTARYGGAICCKNSTAVILDCTLTENEGTSSYGGAVYLSDSDAEIRNCMFFDNENRNTGNFHIAEYGGGAIAILSCSPTIYNCLFYDNYAYKCHGGAVYIDGGSPVLTHCTFSGNDTGGVTGTHGGGVFGTGGTNAAFVNCILYGNQDYDFYEYGTNPITLNYCCYYDLYGSDYVIGNCITSDPLFATGPNGDYYLSHVAAGQASDSPCIDAGSDTAVNMELDSKTTRTDGTTDAGTVDTGYHYEP